MYKPKTCLQGKLAMFMFMKNKIGLYAAMSLQTHLWFHSEAHDSDGYCQMGVSHIEVCQNSLLFSYLGQQKPLAVPQS